MPVQPLSPATDRRLGGPLPRQLSNRTQAHLRAINLWQQNHAVPLRHAVLAAVSSCYSSLPGRLSTCYSPVRHFTRIRRPFHVRLACVRHAASVQSEPESNSPVEKYLIQRTEVLKSNSKLYFPTRSSLVKEPCRSLAAVLLYATFRFTCQQLFSSFFFRRRFQRGARLSRCASARFRVMPIYPRLVKHFFAVFLFFFSFLYLIY